MLQSDEEENVPFQPLPNKKVLPYLTPPYKAALTEHCYPHLFYPHLF